MWIEVGIIELLHNTSKAGTFNFRGIYDFMSFYMNLQ